MTMQGGDCDKAAAPAPAGTALDFCQRCKPVVGLYKYDAAARRSGGKQTVFRWRASCIDISLSEARVQMLHFA
jgi:hypothetical protein